MPNDIGRLFCLTNCSNTLYTGVDDGSDIAELMNCFIQKDVQNPKFPVFSKRIQYLKKDEGGVSIMCEVMEKYAIKYAENEKNRDILAALKKGIAPGRICEVMGVTPERVEKIRKTMEDNLQS